MSPLPFPVLAFQPPLQCGVSGPSVAKLTLSNQDKAGIY